jgi:hypothetical protein
MYAVRKGRRNKWTSQLQTDAATGVTNCVFLFNTGSLRRERFPEPDPETPVT